LSTDISPAPEKKSARRKAGRPLDAAKREAILETAARHFLVLGYSATAIEQIAADAGVSKVTIYNQFGDKRALFSASVECECHKIRGHFPVTNIAKGDLAERLRTIAEGFLAFVLRPEMLQFERRIAGETETDRTIGLTFLEAGPWRVKQAFAEVLAREIAAGELAISDPDLASEQFFSMVKGMADLERRFGVEITPEACRKRIHGAVEVFLAAYGRGTIAGATDR
jgi:TetR/AcrR family transcriptional repressor of mexJK operon